MKDKEVLLQVKNLKKHFNFGKKSILKAVDNVSFDVYKGEIFGIVGESGCGKSTTGKCIVRLHEATDGEILYKGKSISSFDKKESLNYCKEVQMIFQNPYTTLNQRMSIGEILAEGLNVHFNLSKDETKMRVYELLNIVGLEKEHYSRFPHEFSGGQKQRIGIARALSVNPEFIVCDEPISALDVSIQAQVVNLLKDLRDEYNLTYIFVSHDLNMVRYISDRVIVMYLGNVVEMTSTDKLYESQYHPYSQALLNAVPEADPRAQKAKKHKMLEGEVVSPINIGEKCRFVDRCDRKMDICKNVQPQLNEVEKGRFVACHLYNRSM